MKSIFSILLAVVTLLGSFSFARAEMTKDCPVTGKGTSMPVEYKKSLNFCSTKCKEEFDKNPKLYVAKIAAYQEKDGKWRAIELRVAKPKLTIRTRKGYTAGK